MQHSGSHLLPTGRGEDRADVQERRPPRTTDRILIFVIRSGQLERQISATLMMPAIIPSFFDPSGKVGPAKFWT